MQIRLAARLVALLLTLTLAFAFGDKSVFAHADYVSSTPAADATITQAPPTVTVAFSEELTTSSTIQVIDASGARVDLGDGKLDTADAQRKTMVVSLKAGLGNGVYTVKWNAASVDGHSEEGSYSFTVSTATTTATTTVLPATGGDASWVFWLLVAVPLLLSAGILLRRDAA